jgi:hypothetical protein
MLLDWRQVPAPNDTANASIDRPVAMRSVATKPISTLGRTFLKRDKRNHHNMRHGGLAIRCIAFRLPGENSVLVDSLPAQPVSLLIV